MGSSSAEELDTLLMALRASKSSGNSRDTYNALRDTRLMSSMSEMSSISEEDQGGSGRRTSEFTAQEVFSAKLVAMKLKGTVVSDYIDEEYTHAREKFKQSRRRRLTEMFSSSRQLQESFNLVPSHLHQSCKLKYNPGQVVQRTPGLKRRLPDPMTPPRASG